MSFGCRDACDTLKHRHLQPTTQPIDVKPQGRGSNTNTNKDLEHIEGTDPVSDIDNLDDMQPLPKRLEQAMQKRHTMTHPTASSNLRAATRLPRVVIGAQHQDPVAKVEAVVNSAPYSARDPETTARRMPVNGLRN